MGISFVQCLWLVYMARSWMQLTAPEAGDSGANVNKQQKNQGASKSFLRSETIEMVRTLARRSCCSFASSLLPKDKEAQIRLFRLRHPFQHVLVMAITAMCMIVYSVFGFTTLHSDETVYWWTTLTIRFLEVLHYYSVNVYLEQAIYHFFRAQTVRVFLEAKSEMSKKRTISSKQSVNQDATTGFGVEVPPKVGG